MSDENFKPLRGIPVDILNKAKAFSQSSGEESSDQKIRRVGHILFDKLSAIYSSAYFSSEDEIDRAVDFLVIALKNGVDPELMIKKMKQLSSRTDFKTKPHNPILGKYWERDIIPTVNLIPFDIKKNL